VTLPSSVRSVLAAGGSGDHAWRVVAEYLEMHQAALATLAKLRWLLGRSAVVLSEKRLADLTLVPLGNRCLEGVVDVFSRVRCSG
jgi:hypothetical protein